MTQNNSGLEVTESAPPEGIGVFVITLLILVIGWVLAVLAGFWTWEGNLAEGNVRFERRVDRLVTEIQRRVDLPTSGLQSIRGLYLVSDHITEQEFQDFFAVRNLPVEFPGAIGFGFVEHVKAAAVDDYVAKIRNGGMPEFDVHPRNGQQDFYVVRNIAPIEGNEQAWGFDIGLESRRRAALDQALATGALSMTARIGLVQDERKLASFLCILPIFETGTNPSSPELRREKLVGLATVAISLEHTLAGLSKYTDDMLKFDMMDGHLGDDGESIFDFKNHQSELTGLSVTGSDHHGLYSGVREVVVGGRIWTIRISSLKPFDDTVDMIAPTLLGVGGSLLAAMFAAAVWALGNSRARALNLAQNMTQDLAQAKARADAANESKSEFLANMSHEIRTPLTAILGYANILRQDGNSPDDVHRRAEAVKTIIDGGEHLLQIINDILDLSKIEAGKMRVETIETPLIQIINDIDRLMTQRAAEKQITLKTIIQSDIPSYVIGDPTRLRQILINLVGNAVKFTAKGSVCVTVSRCRHYDREVIHCEIEDTGAGMEKAEVESLFRPFTQADGSVTRKYGGTGLGLAISRRLAQAMQGDVRLVRTSPGVGSLFVIELPLVEAEAPQGSLPPLHTPTDAVSDDGQLRCKRPILLAEDNLVNRRLIQYHLEKAGGIVEVAVNGVEALAKLEAARSRGEDIALLLTDMQMPKMDGYTLARTLRSGGFALPIVALTAHAMTEDREKCIAAGCNEYVSKPIDYVHLIKVCNRWCP